MCGRYVLEDFEELSERLIQVPLRYQFHPEDTFNAAPTQTLPVIVEEDEGWTVHGMHWGLIPRWTRPSRGSTRRPGWKKTGGSAKQPYFIHRRDVPLMLLAGLYDEARDENGEPRGSFTIITTAANDRLAPFHDRMPAVLDDDAAAVWMDREETEPAPLTHLLVPFPDEAFDAYPVSREVNNTRHNSPDLIERVADDA